MWVLRPTASVVILVLMATGALGQIILVEDPSGDVRLSMPDGRFRAPAGGGFQHVDIVEAGIWGETDDDLTVFVKTDALDESSERPVPYSDPTFDVRFRYGLQGYRVIITLFLDNEGTAAFGDPESFARLEVEYETGVFHVVADGVAEIDADDDMVRATVPRAAILDHNQAPLDKGRLLTAFSATATSMGWFGVPLFTSTGAEILVGPPMAYDRAPESYFDDPEYRMQTGPTLHKGALLAGSSDPVRWTNGEATTFVYTIRLTNTGTGSLGVLMSVDPNDLGSRWQVAYSDRYVIPASSAINVTLHVAIPFNHNHGLLMKFPVDFRSADDSHQATANLGVYWPVVPQPAGHHDELWFHSQTRAPQNPFQPGTDIHGWLSAGQPDVEPLDEQVPVPPRFITPPGADGKSVATWRLLLEPSLRMGLDFDLTRTGTATLAMTFPLPIRDAEMELAIRHYDRRFILPRVTTIAVQNVAIAGDLTGAVDFEFPEIAIREKADLIRYVSAADLEFNLTLRGTFLGAGFENPSEATPTLRTADSSMQLPLLEYHDPLETTFFTDASARIQVGELGQERQVNPGKKVVYNMYLEYFGAFETDFTIELSGHEAWATPLGAQRFTMQPGERREVAVAVQPPLNAASGTYDTTIRCVSVINAAVQAGMVVRTTVLPGDDIEDESELADQKSQELAPPPVETRSWWPLVLIIVLVVGAAGGGAFWWTRRQ